MASIGILNQRVNRDVSPTATAEEHFDQMAQEARSAVLSRGLSAS